ncbi:MAG: hypothetical protein HYW26_01380 [Candidatus Aenigmarchaeota archaeon]|nr:hypothetical protein [Candidatus Aenigmarchaeota archaeon]
MNKEFNNWLVIGVIKNWETALSHPVPLWGLKPRYQSDFSSLNVGDFIWFYATSPVKGIIGIGRVKDKYIDNVNPVWEEEKKNKEVIWPLRFRIQILKTLSRDKWKTDKIDISDFRLNWQVGFQLLDIKKSIRLFELAESTFGTKTTDLFRGSTIIQPVVSQPMTVMESSPKYIAVEHITSKGTLSHRDLQNTIAEIGKLQFYHTELEYPINLSHEDKNIDVVWKREISGVPTYVFEVELSGMIERAVMRLKFAFNRWNSLPRIVVPKEAIKKILNIASAEDKHFSDKLKIYEPIHIMNLIEKKRELKGMEENLGLY